jgi:protocatechuate 3,4-dioxygenase beta subunit
VTTDGRGRFVFEAIKADQYRFEVSALGVLAKPGKVTVRDLSSPVTPSSKPTVSEGFVTLLETDSLDVEILARKGGVLTGRITFEDGYPVTNGLVSAWKIGSGGSCHRVNVWHGATFVSHAFTDDLGKYRIAGLSYGDYVVSATTDFPLVGQSDEGRWTTSRPGLTPTYSGGGVGCSDALSFRVEEGRETEAASIVLKDRPTYAVSGSLTSLRTGSPIQQAELTIQRDDGDTDVENSTSPDSNGHWKFEGLQTGKYTITVIPRLGTVFDGNRIHATPGESPERYARKQQPVKIEDADVAGMAITLSAGTLVEGRISIDGGGPLPSGLEVRIVRDPLTNIRPGLLDCLVRVGRDAQFVMSGIPEGQARFDILGLEKNGLYLKSILWNGQDLKSVPFTVGGPIISGVQIMLVRKTLDK